MATGLNATTVHKATLDHEIRVLDQINRLGADL